MRPVPVLTLLALAVLATPALAHRDDPKAYLRFEGAIGDESEVIGTETAATT